MIIISSLYDDIEESVLNQIFRKSLSSDWPKEQEFRIALFLDEKDIIRERYTFEYELKNLQKNPEYITICSEFPVNHLTKSNNDLPIFERKTAPLFFYLNIKPQALIIGNKCPDILKKELIAIANRKEIVIRNQGDIND
jgi:hypothetical protein